MRNVLVRVVTVLSLAALAAPAAAHDHSPPSLTMRVEGEVQEGKLVYTGWYTKQTETSCVHGDIFGPDAYPEAIEVTRGSHSVRVRIAKRHRPDYLEVRTWQATTPEGGAGPPDVVEHTLKPIRRDGRVRAYRILFDVSVLKDLYIKVLADWRDREGCGGELMGRWNFHLGAEI